MGFFVESKTSKLCLVFRRDEFQDFSGAPLSTKFTSFPESRLKSSDSNEASLINKIQHCQWSTKEKLPLKIRKWLSGDFKPVYIVIWNNWAKIISGITSHYLDFFQFLHRILYDFFFPSQVLKEWKEKY